MKRAMCGLFCAAVFLTGAGKAAAGPVMGVDFAGTPTPTPNNIYNLGFAFRAETNIIVTALGNVDLTGNGYAQPQQVGLWNSSGVLLASTFVSNADPLVSGRWRFHAISEVALIAGQTYIVGAQGGALYASPTPITVNPNITYLDDWFAVVGSPSNNPLVMPNITLPGLNTPSSAGWFGANLQFETVSTVPEPATVTLLAIGIAGMAGYGWRKRKQAAA